MAQKLRILDSGDIMKVLGMPEVLDLVERAFLERGRGILRCPPRAIFSSARMVVTSE